MFFECAFTKRVIACAREFVLCREHCNGRAATVAKFKYNEHASVGDGCNDLMAACNVSAETLSPNFDFKLLWVSNDKCDTWPIIRTG